MMGYITFFIAGFLSGFVRDLYRWRKQKKQKKS
jgi:hypothetical protein